MELEGLVLKEYRVEKIKGEMVATLGKNGHYRAGTADEVEALTTGITADMFVEVRIGKKWSRMQPSTQPSRRGQFMKEHWAKKTSGY